MAYQAMGDSYGNVGETALSVENSRKAFELRAGVSEPEKLLIEADYYYSVGDLLKARRSCEIGTQTYPRNSFFHNILGVSANSLGQYQTGLKENLESLRLAPYNSFFYRNVVFTYLLLNRVEDAAASAKEAKKNGLGSNLAVLLYGIAFYQDDTAEMARQVAGAADKPGDDDLLLASRPTRLPISDILEKPVSSAAGRRILRCGPGRKKPRQVTPLYPPYGKPYSATQRKHDSRQRSQRTFDWARYGLWRALALAFSGDDSKAQALADDLGKRFPRTRLCS